MEDWKEYNLGELIELKNGVAFKSSEFVDHGVPVIKIKNVKPNRILVDDLSYVSQETSLNKRCFDILPTDILITMTGNRKDGGADSWVGKVALFNQTGRYLLNQRVSAIRVKDNRLVDNVYLSYLLSSWDAQLYFVNHSNSSGGQANISPDVVYNYPVALPPLSVQLEIASILKSLDDKIECNRRINENLEQQAQALFDNVLMNEELPRDKVLKDYAFINPTRSKKKGEIARYIDMSSLPTKGSFPSDWVNKPYNGGMKFQNGDTLMARITPCLENGKTAYINFLDIDEVAFGSTEYIVMAPHDGIPSELFYFLARNKDFVSYAVAHMNGSSGRQRVSATDIESYIMPNIPSDLIKQFGERAEVIMECIKTNSIENRRLAELRDTLLPRLMSGELKVQNIDLINEMLAKGIR